MSLDSSDLPESEGAISIAAKVRRFELHIRAWIVVPRSLNEF